MGSKGQSDCGLRWLGARLPHQPRRQRLRALRCAAPRDHLRRRRRRRNHLRRLRRRQDATIRCPRWPCRARATITITSFNPAHSRQSTPAPPFPKAPKSTRSAEVQAPRKILGRAKTTSSTPSPRAPTACSRSPAIADTSSASKRTAAYADIAHLEAQQGLSLAVEPDPRNVLVGTGNTGKLFRLGAGRKARVRQRCPRCRRIGPLRPHRSRARLQRL